MRIWNGLKLSISISIIFGLIFSGALFTVLLYAKIADKELAILAPKNAAVAVETVNEQPAQTGMNLNLPANAANFFN